MGASSRNRFSGLEKSMSASVIAWVVSTNRDASDAPPPSCRIDCLLSLKWVEMERGGEGRSATVDRSTGGSATRRRIPERPLKTFRLISCSF